METKQDTTELTLEAQLTETETETELTLEASIVPIANWPRKQRNQYLGKLRLLGTIHAEIADKLDEKRRTVYEAFFMPEDKWLPASREKDLLVRFALGKVVASPESEAETMPSEA